MTLVETVIALFLAVFLIAGVCASLVCAARQFAEARARTYATNIVNQEIESLRTLSFTELESNASDLSSITSSVTIGQITFTKVVSVGPQPFTIAWSIAPSVGTGTTTSLIEALITVSWSIGTHRGYISSSTLIAKAGLASAYSTTATP